MQHDTVIVSFTFEQNLNCSVAKKLKHKHHMRTLKTMPNYLTWPVEMESPVNRLLRASRRLSRSFLSSFSLTISAALPRGHRITGTIPTVNILCLWHSFTISFIFLRHNFTINAEVSLLLNIPALKWCILASNNGSLFLVLPHRGWRRRWIY